MEVMASLVLEDGSRWGAVATSTQIEDARAVLAREPEVRRHWIGRSRGYSKTSDVAGMTLAAMVSGTMRSGERGYAVAADADQARLLVDAAAGFVSRASHLNGLVRVEARRLVGTDGIAVEVVPADASSAFGLRGSWWVVDEICQWSDAPQTRRLFEAISTAWPKLPHSRVVVISTAGDPAHWSRRLYDLAEARDSWHVSEVHGPAPWLDDGQIDEERTRLPDSAFRRLFLNEWTAPEDRLVVGEDLAACRVLDPWPVDYVATAAPYAVALDIGLTSDRTVLAVCHVERTDDGEAVVLDRMQVWAGTRRDPVSLTEVEAAVALASKSYGNATVILDPWQGALLTERLRARSIRVEEFVFSAQSVGRVGVALHQRLRGRSLRLPVGEEDLADELANVRMRESSPGMYRLDHDSGRHDDRAVALGLACTWLGDNAQRSTEPAVAVVPFRRNPAEVFDYLPRRYGWSIE